VLILLPVFLPIFAAIVILVAQGTRPRSGIAYLLAVIAALANWGIILSFYWHSPPSLALPNWLPFPDLASVIVFQLDSVSWPYAFAIASLTAAVILTASARLAMRSLPSAWAGNLLVSGVAILAIIASSSLALILAWTLLDITELIFILVTVNQASVSRQAVLAFSARALGTFFIIIAMVVSQSQGRVLLLIDPPQAAGVFLLIAAGLRLGVLPLHLPYSEEVPLRRGIGTSLRLASPASSLVLLTHLPSGVVPPALSPYLLLFAALAGLYGAAMWLSAKDEVKGRPYWMIALAGMCVGSAIRGYPLASLAWGTALIFSGGVLFLYSAREKFTFAPLGIALLGLSGLPFSPAASGWSGLIIPPINAPDFIFLVAHILLMAGFLRHALRPGETLSRVERWIQVLYPVGLYFLALSGWVVAAIGWTQFSLSRVWPASIVSAVLVIVYLVWQLRFQDKISLEFYERSWVVILGRRAARFLSAVFRLDWLYRFLSLFYRAIQSLLQILTTILEGEGGILWVFVLLALLLALVEGGQP
jgi:hypothetical protein